MGVCLLPEKIPEFKKALKESRITMGDLLNKSSAELEAIFSEFTDPQSAKDITVLFEQKRILKNKVRGLKNAVSKLGQMGRYEPGKKAEIDKAIADFREKQKERIFSPKEFETFYAFLAEKKLGTEVTREESATVFALDKKRNELLKKYDEETGEWTSEEDKLAYGAADVAYKNYITYLYGNELPIKQMLSNRWQEFKTALKERPVKGVVDLLADTAHEITNNSISLVATLDNSFMGRQGAKVLFKNPKVWWNNIVRPSFKDIKKELKGQNTLDALMADIFSNENYLNGEYKKAGIIPKSEEQFPGALPARIPGLGRVFKASESAFKGSALRARTKLYDIYKKVKTDNGLEWTNDEIKSAGLVINSLTARGEYGKGGEHGVEKLILWAPRMLKANWDVLIGQPVLGQKITKTAQIEAAKNLLTLITSTAIIMAIFYAIDEDSVEFDPRSSDFKAIKIGNTRFSMPGTYGEMAIITLATRLFLGMQGKPAFKSSTTHKVKKFGEAFGDPTALDALIDFFANKTTPAAGVILSLLRGETFSGEKPTIGSAVMQGFAPIPLKNAINLKDEHSLAAVVGVLTDFLGQSASTYGYKPGGKEWDALKAVDPVQYRKEAKKLNDSFAPKLDELEDTEKYKNASQTEKNAMIDALLKKEKDAVAANFKEIISTAKSLEEGSKHTQEGFIDKLSLYAQAIGADPVVAFSRLFTGQTIRRVTNGAIIVERMPLSKSEAIKRDRGGNNPTMKLDHTVPLQLGGSNSRKNLQLVPTEEWERYTPVENYLGDLLINSKINKKDAKRAIKDFKAGNITFEDIKAEFPK